MGVYSHTLKLNTEGNTDVVDITRQIQLAVEKTNINNGIVVVFVPGSTGALSTIEYENGAVTDLKDVIERLIPKNYDYKHNYTWNDGNGHSHIRATIIGPSITIPVINGEITLGTWQQVIFIDFDTRPRRRNLIVQIIGE